MASNAPEAKGCAHARTTRKATAARRRLFGEQGILIPSVYRGNCLAAQRALTRNDGSELLIRAWITRNAGRRR